MARTKFVRITFDYWSGLMTGRIATIHGAKGASLHYVRQKDGGSVFVMQKIHSVAKHVLAADVTDEVRLNAHFSGFQRTAP